MKWPFPTLWLFLLCPCISLAQSTPSNASTAAIANDNGKDYAGRPVGNTQAPQLPPPSPIEKQQIEQSLKEIYFDFDRADLRAQDRATLESDAQWLKAHPQVLVTIDGGADERGDIVYNVALSDRRAIATRNALLSMGVPEDQLVFVTGWGKLYPVCNEPAESCWSRNRRAHLAEWGESGQKQAGLTIPAASRP